MSSRQERKIKEGAQPFLEVGEEILAAFVARPRGWTRSAAAAGVGGLGGAVGRELGARQQGQAPALTEPVDFRLESPMALAVTQRRLLVLKISSPIGFGIGGAVKELASAAPLADVDSVEVKRLALGKTITVTVRGVPFELEANASADASGLADAFSRAKAAA